MISNKEVLINQTIEKYKSDQYRFDHLNPSLTKLGPCMQQYDKISLSSWWPPYIMPEKYINKMQEVGEKFQNLSWVPLNLPKFNIGDLSVFEEIWERESIEIKNNNDPSYITEFKGLHITANCLLDFNLHDLYVNGKMSKTQVSDASGYSQGRNVVGAWSKKLYKHKFFFNLISEIMDKFPIRQISNMLILETINDVLPHREQSWVWKCPTEFRIMLHDENTEPTIYVTNIQTGKTTYIDLPSDTNSFAWSNGNYIYGIDYHGKKSYQLVVNAIWDSNKLEKLLENSLQKYHAIL
jgi:hypothetical protein